MSHAAASERFDLYRKIHKGVRRAMFGVTERLGAADFSNGEEASVVCQELRELLGFLTRHGEHELEFIHRRFDQKLPGFFEAFDGDHVDQEREMAELEALSRQVEQAEAEVRPELGFSLYLRVADFVAGFLRHIGEEERQITPKLWEIASDRELMALQGRILDSQSPPEQMASLRHMLPALDPSERAALLGAVQSMAPPEAFSAVVDLARAVLSDRSWERLRRDLGLESAPVAQAAAAPPA